MSKTPRLFMVAAVCVALLLTQAYWVIRRPVPASVSPESLVQSCGIITYQDAQVGMGFFVAAQGRYTNIYFITAAHTLVKIRERDKRDAFDLKVAVKRKAAAGSTELKLLCNDVTVTAFPMDFAAVQVDNSVLCRPDIDVNPIPFRMTGAAEKPERSQAKQPGAFLDQDGFVTADQLQTKMETFLNNAPEGRKLGASEVRSGESGFLLYHARTNLNVGMGSEIFTLVSQKCDAAALANDLFPVFFRKGVLAFAKEDPARYEANSSCGRKPNLLIIDCQSSRGNSGAPVFVLKKETFYWDRVCETPHVLGILVDVVTAKGDAQAFDLPVLKDGREIGRINGEQVFKENAGLSVVVPIDYLALWLMERERFR